MKRIWLFLMCLPLFAMAQNSEPPIDSLKLALKSAKGLERVKTQYNLATLLVTSDPVLADSLSLDALNQARERDFEEGIMLASIVQATLANLKGDLEKSKMLLNEAVEMATRNDSKSGLSKAHTALGSLYLRMGEYTLATENHLKGLSAAESFGNFDVQVTNLMNIGLVKQRIGALDEAFDFFDRALKICEERDLVFRKGQMFINLGVLEFNRQNVGSSIDYNQKALDIFRGFNDKPQQAICLQNIGFANAHLKNYTEANDYYDRAIDIREQVGDRRGIAAILLNKARLMIETDKTDQAIEIAGQALTITEEIKNARLNMSLNLFLSELYESLQDSHKAYGHYKQYVVVKDSMTLRANKARIAELTAGFEFDKQQKALQQSQDELRLVESQRWVLMLIILVMLIVAVVTFLFLRARAVKIKLEKQLLEEEKKTTDLKRQKLEKEVELKAFELKGYVESLRHKNEIIEEIKTRLDEVGVEKGLEQEDLNKIATGVDGRSTTISLEEFRIKFSSVHQDFITKIIDSHGALTQNEIDLCIFFKVNLTYKDIAQIQNISYEGVKKAIQRLYKKLGYRNAEDLRLYLLGV